MDRKEGHMKYIGIKSGFLEKFKDRIIRVPGDLKISGGVWLISHSAENMKKAGGTGAYVSERRKWLGAGLLCT